MLVDRCDHSIVFLLTRNALSSLTSPCNMFQVLCASGAYSVSGAGDQTWDGCYTKKSDKYEKDATHLLYKKDGIWRLADKDEKVFYQGTAASESPGHFSAPDAKLGPAPLVLLERDDTDHGNNVFGCRIPFGFVKYPNMAFKDSSLEIKTGSGTSITFAQCSKSCHDNAACGAFGYAGSTCSLKASALLTDLKSVPSSDGMVTYVKNLGWKARGEASGTDFIETEIVLAVADVSAIGHEGLATVKATLQYKDGAALAPVPLKFQFVEPLLQLVSFASDKTLVESGDIITYTLKLKNSRTHGDAYHVYLQDFLPTGTKYVSVAVTPSSIGPVSAPDPGSTISVYRIPAGTTATFVYKAEVRDHIVTNVPFTVRLDGTWRSHPGENNWPGEKEYTGSFGTRKVNVKQPSMTSTLLRSSDISKELVSMTEGRKTQVRIGENITITTDITLIKGTTPLSLLLTFPSRQVEYIASSVLFVSSAVTDRAKKLSTAIKQRAPGQMAFEFGDTINRQQDAEAGKTVRVQIVVQARDVKPDNENKVLIDISLSLEYGSGAKKVTRNVLDIIEPSLTVTKTVSSPKAAAGDILTFTIKSKHTSFSRASSYHTYFDLTLDKKLKLLPDFNLDLKVSEVAGVTSPSKIVSTSHHGATLYVEEVLKGCEVTITLAALVLNIAEAGQNYGVETNLKFKSHQHLTKHLRDYDLDFEPIQMQIHKPTFALTRTRSLIQDDWQRVPPSTSKSNTLTTPGETFTYQLKVALPEGSTPLKVDLALPKTDVLELMSDKIKIIAGDRVHTGSLCSFLYIYIVTFLHAAGDL